MPPPEKCHAYYAVVHIMMRSPPECRQLVRHLTLRHLQCMSPLFRHSLLAASLPLPLPPFTVSRECSLQRAGSPAQSPQLIRTAHRAAHSDDARTAMTIDADYGYRRPSACGCPYCTTNSCCVPMVGGDKLFLSHILHRFLHIHAFIFALFSKSKLWLAVI